MIAYSSSKLKSATSVYSVIKLKNWVAVVGCMKLKIVLNSLQYLYVFPLPQYQHKNLQLLTYNY